MRVLRQAGSPPSGFSIMVLRHVGSPMGVFPHHWWRTCLVENLHGGEPAWHRTRLAENLHGGEPAWRRTRLAENPLGGEPAWQSITNQLTTHITSIHCTLLYMYSEKCSCTSMTITNVKRAHNYYCSPQMLLCQKPQVLNGTENKEYFKMAKEL